MEAQLRRLWPRRKSLKKTTKPEIKDLPPVPLTSGFAYSESYEATVSGPPPEVGTLPLKPSDNTRSKKPFGHSKAQSAGLQEFLTVTDKDVHTRAKSTGGIQPIFIGISRPITSESIQKDVISTGTVNGKPAPTPAAPRLNTAASLPQPRTAQRFQPVVKRHLDIMSFAAANGKHLEGYNEEVAARNLDLKTLARQSATTISVTKSKYHEDVATRNTATMGYRYKPSARTQSVPEDHRSDSLDSTASLNASSSAMPPVYRHKDMTIPRKTTSVQESAAYHSRNGSTTSNSSNTLSAIILEFPIEDVGRKIPWLEKQQQYEGRRRRQKTAEPGPAFTRYPSIHGKNILESSDQRAPVPPLPRMTTRANQSRPIANSSLKEYGHPLHSNPYEAPVAEYVNYAKRGSKTRHERLPSRRKSSKSSQYPSDDLSCRTGVSSSRTSSADHGRPTSSSNYNGDVGNRTFMDLTKDEAEKQSQYESPNTEYLESLILAQARADMAQVHRAQLTGLTSSHYQGLLTPSDTDDYGTSSKGLSALNRQSKRWSSAYSDTGSVRSEQPLGFSTVTTVSSMSPNARPTSKLGPAAENSRIAKPREPTSQSSTSRRVPFSDIPRPSTSNEVVNQSQPKTLDPPENIKPSTFYDDTPSEALTEQQGETATQSFQVLYTSPESLRSGDFTDPSRAFGVLTRDFASTPSRQSTVRQQLPRQKSLTGLPGYPTRPELPGQLSQPTTSQEQKYTTTRGYEHKSSDTVSNVNELPSIREPSRSPQLYHVDTPIKELTASYFDESEFARKQAQARAALLRLQMSLEEQYDMSPGRPDSSAQRHIARQILDQNRKPQLEERKISAPPTSMYYEKREYQSRAKTNRPTPLRTPSEDTRKASSGYSYEKSGPNSFAQSIHSTVTIAPTTTHPPTTNGHTKFSTAGSASHSYNYANGASTNNGSRAPSTLPNPPLTPVLPSPSGTEVSLSSFPMPQAPEVRGRRPAVENDRPRTARMHSTKSSVASIASVYSIPHHMVPSRSSSRRDTFDEEV
jgi:hypothetical protein